MNLHRVPNHVARNQDLALEVLAAGGEVERNEYGVFCSVHVCKACGHRFRVIPPSATFGDYCLAPECKSYDPARDAEVYFAPDDPDLIEP